VGEGPLRAVCETQVKALGLQGTVLFTGYRRDAPAILSILAASVLASVSEGFPGVAIETFAAGTPLVCTDLPAFRGVVSAGREALMVPMGDAAALAAAILRILNEPELARQLVERARQVAARCEISAIAERYVALYERLVPQASSTS
jgi:glycosyltransferase involved in cell wall biosynthesis